MISFRPKDDNFNIIYGIAYPLNSDSILKILENLSV